MRKIPTLFKRSGSGAGTRLLPEAKPECQWVLDGEGVPTRKYDGTCILLDAGGFWWARREVKPGKAAPENYRPIMVDETTGKTVGWEPIEQSSFVKFWREACHEGFGGGYDPGTYELIGPKINGNPEGVLEHRLIRHADASRLAEPIGGRTFESLKRQVLNMSEASKIEGIVWHHPDGWMAKLKARDFR